MNEGAGIIAFTAVLMLSNYLARRGTDNAATDLERAPAGEPGEMAARQTRQDVAAILSILPLTNALLAAIAATLIFG